MPASVPFRVLILEDNPTDAELMLDELHQAKFDPEWQRVQTEEEYIAHLHPTLDLILADYSMPQFNALSALKILQEWGWDIPFIIVSGSIGEELAVTAMRQGAADYLLKDRLARLGPAVEHALEAKHLRDAQRQAEAILRRSEQNFRNLFANNPLPMWVYDRDSLMFLDVNEAAIAHYGYSREEFLSMRITDIRPVEDVPRLLQSVIQKRDLLQFAGEWRHRRKNGDIFDVEITSHILEFNGSEAVLVVAQDISERKQAEAELKALYNAISYLFKTDNLLDLGHQIVRAIITEFGQIDCGVILIDERQNKLLLLAHSGEYEVNIDAPLYLDGSGLVAEAMRNGKMVYAPNAEAHPLSVPNEPRTRSELVVPMQTAKGIVGVLDLQSMELDAFNQRNQRILSSFAERAAAAIETMRLYEEINRHAAALEWRVAQRTADLQRAKERTEAILSNSSDAIILAYLDGNIEQVNPAFGSLWGYTADEAFGQSLISLVETHQVEALSNAFHTVITSRQSVRVETRCLRQDGTVFDGDMALSLIIGDKETIANVICSVRDITERKRLESELRQSLDREKELNELKSRFISMTSHEFRTPLTTISTSAGLLKMHFNKMNPEQRLKHFANIQTAIRQMTQLLEDVLLIGRAEAGRLEFNPERLDLEVFCRDLVEEIQAGAGKTHTLVFSERGQYENVMVDRKLLRQILTNLLGNAVKYSPVGNSVYFDLVCEDGQVVFRVQDKGIGIPEKDQKHLFETFYRANNVGTIPGTGLGLAITQRAVELHGGDIRVESQIGIGTTFIVTIPTRQEGNP